MILLSQLPAGLSRSEVVGDDYVAGSWRGLYFFLMSKAEQHVVRERFPPHFVERPAAIPLVAFIVKAQHRIGCGSQNKRQEELREGEEAEYESGKLTVREKNEAVQIEGGLVCWLDYRHGKPLG